MSEPDRRRVDRLRRKAKRQGLVFRTDRMPNMFDPDARYRLVDPSTIGSPQWGRRGADVPPRSGRRTLGEIEAYLGREEALRREGGPVSEAPSLHPGAELVLSVPDEETGRQLRYRVKVIEQLGRKLDEGEEER